MGDKLRKSTQKTVTGHEIPVPRRSTFLRDLKKVSRPADADALLKKEPKKPPS
jgi:hypothetical protein